MLAHELRNPLTTIQYANSVSRLANSAGHDTSYADMIDAQVKHLARLIDDLLDVARITKNRIELQTEPLDAAEVVARAVEAARPLVERRRHHLRVHIDPGPLPLVADATRLEQIVQNLLNNAAKYTAPGGQIEVAARKEGASLLLSVKDNGAGMSSDLVARIFEPFTQGETTIDRSQGGLERVYRVLAASDVVAGARTGRPRARAAAGAAPAAHPGRRGQRRFGAGIGAVARARRTHAGSVS
jgi:signal transduction histidine kinase